MTWIAKKTYLFIFIYTITFLSITTLEVKSQTAQEKWNELNGAVVEAYQAGDYAEGVRLAEEALELARASLGPTHPSTLTSLNNLAGLYQSQGRYGEAEPLFEQALELSRQTLGPTHPDTLISLNNLAGLYDSQERYDEAEPLYEQALELSRQTLGPTHPDTLISLNNLAGLYDSQGRYGEAEPLLEQALELSRQTLGPTHPDTLISLNNLAFLYWSQGRYGEAEPLYEQALELRRQTLGPTHPNTLNSLNNLALLYSRQGRYGEAEPLFEQALELFHQTLGPTHPSTLTSLNNLAFLYWSQGRYGEAEPLYEQALELSRQTLGPTHPSTLTSLNNLATLYDSQGRYGEAEPLYEQALELRRQTLGPTHPDTLISLNNLAGLYESQGRYGEAELLYKQALELRRQTLGPTHPDTLASLNNLAGLYSSQGRYGEAEPLLEQALELSRQTLGPTHPDTLHPHKPQQPGFAVLTSLNNLAGLYDSQGRYGEAEPLFEQALELRRQTLGPTHPSTLTSLNNLALLYSRQGRYGEAEPLYEEAWSSARQVLGASHPTTLSIQLNSAGDLAAQEHWQAAVARLRQMEPQLITRLGAELYSTRGAAVRHQLVASQADYQHAALSLGLVAEAPLAARELAASSVLRFKGLQAEEEAYIASIIRRGDDPHAIELAKEIATLRSALASSFNSSSASPEQLETLQQQLEARELELGRISRAYAQHLQVRNANLGDLQATLPAGTALLEIRQYQPADFKAGQLGELRYAGVLTIGFDTLEILDLGPVEPSQGRIEALIAGGDDASQAARALYQQILEPFADHLADIDNLIIAPDGPLYLVPFARLERGDGQLLAESVDLHIVQTGRDLLRQPIDRPGTGLLALGGIDFDHHEITTAALDQATVTSPFLPDPQQAGTATREALPGGFSSLPGSREEVERIASRYRTARPQEPVDVWNGPDASEARLQNLATPPRVLHLATHGFYREPKDPADRPMLLSGIALAGANDALEEDRDDGILYAVEAQGLNLEGTELVILSACKAAQGQLDYSEGVFGLVRALRTAGARQVLVTLKPVGDYKTIDFMNSFYRHWLNQQRSNPAQALRATQLDYIRAGKPADLWTPFVLVGE